MIRRNVLVVAMSITLAVTFALFTIRSHAQTYSGYLCSGYSAYPWSPAPPTPVFSYGPMIPADIYPARSIVVQPVLIDPWGGEFLSGRRWW